MKRMLAVLLASSVLTTPVWAGVLKKIQITGTNRIEDATIMNYLQLNKGDDVSADDLDRATKTLFATGLFSDVDVSMNNGVARITVRENPIVHNIYFEGNKKLSDETLLKEVLLKPRMVYTQNKLQNDATRLQDVYKRNGRFGATVVPKIVEKDQNRVDVVFEITEGDQTTIKKINFIGNKDFSSDELRDVLITKEKAWWRIFSSTDTYDPDRLNYDKEMLRRFYLQHGYVDFDAPSMVAELTPDQKGFIITIAVKEGKKYRFAKPNVVVSLPEYQNNQDLNKLISVEDGKRFNSDLIESSITALTDYFAGRGYAFANVEPTFEKDEQARTVKIIFHVNEGERIYVNRIDINGNTRTLDKVIRREFRLKEGDPFNPSKLRRSKTNVEDLGYFEKVDIKTSQSSVPGKMDVAVDVSEQSTGSFNVGVGYSSYDGLLFDVGIKERNLLGTGNEVGVNAMISQKEQDYVISATNPYFLDHRVTAGVDVFHTTRDYEDTSSYKSQSTGATIRFGWDYTEHLRHNVRYTIEEQKVTDVSSDASIYIKEQEGKETVSLIGQNLIYDKRDSRLNPTEGYYLNAGLDYAGIGGDVDFVRVTGTAIKYFPVLDDVVFSLRTDGGSIWGLSGQKVRINNRFFLGDASLRGFEYGGVGARDKATDDFLGGDWYATASAEFVFPVGLPKEMGVKGKVFSDAGFIGKPSGFDAETMDYSDALRASVGVGVVWQSPMGTIGVDFAAPIRKEKQDKTRIFRLNFGKGF